jgi:hypothetical protein
MITIEDIQKTIDEQNKLLADEELSLDETAYLVYIIRELGRLKNLFAIVSGEVTPLELAKVSVRLRKKMNSSVGGEKIVDNEKTNKS